MKVPLFVPLVFATVLAAAPLFALPDSKEGKPEDTPAPLSTLQGEAKTPERRVAREGSPARQVEDFFRLLTEGRVDAAYDQLVKGTKIAESPKDVGTLKLKTREALRVFGDINGYEEVEIKEVGTRLCRITCISIGKQFPIRWRFYFYKGRDVSQLIDIRIDDRLMDMFEEPAPVVKSSPAK